MLELYKKILDKNKNVVGLKTVDYLVSNSGCTEEVNNKLIANGFPIQSLDYKQKAIFFTALCDIIVVVRNNDYYLATFNTDKIHELHSLGRIIPNAGESDLSGVDKLIRYNTKEVISQYLMQKKFHLIKLNVYEKSRTNFTLVSLSGMNPYPSFCDGEVVYSLSSLANWHNELSNALIKGIYKIKTANGDFICQNYLGRPLSVCTGGVLLTKDLNNNLIELPLWSITNYEPYNSNDFVRKLYAGVVDYDGKEITLNRDLLEKYYGEKNVNGVLESKGVRYRYCLEELLSIGNKWSLAYYINKYAIDIYDCDNIYDLQLRLKSLCAKEKKEDPCIINARVLTSMNSITSGHVSYYVKINLDKLQSHSVKVIENIADVMPKIYQYYAISPSLGYNYVSVKATSDNLALKYGKTEFERQFGGDSVFMGLYTDKVIKGHRPYKFGIDIQRRLCQNIMYGYRDNYQGYAQIIYKMLADNDIDTCSDEAIQLLYINQLARKYKYGADVKLVDVMEQFISFCEVLQDSEALHKKLVEEKSKISYRRCLKEYESISKALPDLTGYKVDDTPDGKFVVTQYGRFKITKNGVGKTIELFYNNEYLCNKIVKE